MKYYHLHHQLPNIQIRTHSQAKHLKLKIQHDHIILVTPPYASDHHIQQFLSYHQDWLLAHWKKPTLKSELILFNFHTACSEQFKINYLAPEAFKLYEYQPKQKVIEIHPTQPQQALKQFILDYARHHLPLICMDIAQKMNRHIHKISIRHAKSRWGSCSTQQHIMLNAYLVCCPIHLIRYVCIHEIAHTVHFNHSDAFWALVKQYDPQYQQHRKELKQYTISF